MPIGRPHTAQCVHGTDLSMPVLRPNPTRVRRSILATVTYPLRGIQRSAESSSRFSYDAVLSGLRKYPCPSAEASDEHQDRRESEQA